MNETETATKSIDEIIISPTTTVVIIICCFGLLGNILCAILLSQKQLKSSFNYLLLGLTFSDSLLLVVSLLWALDDIGILDLTTSPPSVEKTIFILDWLCTSGTKYFTVAASLERYIAICHPLRATIVFAKGREARGALIVFGFCAILSAWSYIYVYHIDSISFHIYAAVVLHFLPFALVLILNTLLYFGLRKFQVERKNLTENEAGEVSVTKVLLCVVLVFGFCYAFEFTRRILNYLGYFDLKEYDYNDYTINALASIFYVLNSSVNFIIYCLIGKKLRTEFIILMKHWFSQCCPYFETSTITTKNGVSTKQVLSTPTKSFSK